MKPLKKQFLDFQNKCVFNQNVTQELNPSKHNAKLFSQFNKFFPEQRRVSALYHSGEPNFIAAVDTNKCVCGHIFCNIPWVRHSKHIIKRIIKRPRNSIIETKTYHMAQHYNNQT